MRAREFLREFEGDISKMKSDIITKVKTSNDNDLIQKIYTTLHKTGLVDRIAPVLQRDTDTKGYVDELVNIIIETPGKYEEKVAFIDEYPNGYIDIPLMLSGEYVKFENLIKGGPGAPLEFVNRVFQAMKKVTFGGAKGPGEFALAVLSPHIKITGKGDLHIGNAVIEVKANAAEISSGGGGRIGTPGLLSSDNIPEILNKYMSGEFSGLNLKQLSSTMDNAGLDPRTKKKLATELFNYIFKKKTDVSDIVNAVVSGQDPSPAYLKANYDVYQQETQFDGIMLINFPAQACKYFVNPEQMAAESYAFSVYLISKNPSHQAKQVLAQVNLRPVSEPTTPVPAKSKADTTEKPKNVKQKQVAPKVAEPTTQKNTQSVQPPPVNPMAAKKPVGTAAAKPQTPSI